MKKLIYLLIAIMVVTSFYGCGNKGDKMHGPKKNPQGLAMPEEPIDKDKRGKDVIKLTEELKYPGMTQYHTAKYDFLSNDTPQTVSDWFLSNLKGSTAKKYTAGEGGIDTEWLISYKDITINILPYDKGSLLRYKTKLK